MRCLMLRFVKVSVALNPPPLCGISYMFCSFQKKKRRQNKLSSVPTAKKSPHPTARAQNPHSQTRRQQYHSSVPKAPKSPHPTARAQNPHSQTCRQNKHSSVPKAPKSPRTNRACAKPKIIKV